MVSLYMTSENDLQNNWIPYPTADPLWADHARESHIMSEILAEFEKRGYEGDGTVIPTPIHREIVEYILCEYESGARIF